MSITTPGIYEMSAEEYHADCCEPFSLSRGVAHMLLKENPRKAWHSHPKLGGKGNIVPNKAMDAGSMVHGLILGAGAEMQALTSVYGPKHESAGEPVRNFMTKEAKTECVAIRKAGRIPVLAHEEQQIRDCSFAGVAQLSEHPDGKGFFEPGQAEAVVVWQEDGLWFRIMVDRLPDNPRASPYDLKMTKMSAAPGSWDRRLQGIYAFQDAFYRRGLRAVRGVEPGPLLFPVVELTEPYCMAMHAAAPSLRDIAERQVERAIRQWRTCVQTNNWPGYPAHTAWVEATGWQINQADEDDLRDEFYQEQAA